MYKKTFFVAVSTFLMIFLLMGCTTTPTSVATDAPADVSTDAPAKSQIIYKGTSLTQGYDMGVDTSGQLRNWVTDMHDSMCMNYPGNQGWGAVFITFGKSVPVDQRQTQDLSTYKTLSMELKGENGGEYLSIGLKDKTDPDDGSERKYSVTVTNDWKAYTFPLSDFDTADATQLYVVTEFVFEPDTPAENVCFRNIEYLP
ncbi:MAG TPA: hypothetical protein PKL78_02165 [Anaerolineales bacterium]|nr:hypothetical protein [Anaerolineales bacterium]HNJ90825.1 hypothetical protein [Chitinophagales bacterium]HNK62696.1 hypothetical protein [Anaerolineales bacterium]HNN12333.1 hypothetical protein [Anaerolineales bacterium]